MGREDEATRLQDHIVKLCSEKFASVPIDDQQIGEDQKVIDTPIVPEIPKAATPIVQKPPLVTYATRKKRN